VATAENNIKPHRNTKVSVAKNASPKLEKNMNNTDFTIKQQTE